MYKQYNPFNNNFEMPDKPQTNDLEAQAQYWCNLLGITTDQLGKMSEMEMEHRVQAFQRNYRGSGRKNHKKIDNRNQVFRAMKEADEVPPYTPRRKEADEVPPYSPRRTSKNTPRLQADETSMQQSRSPERSARKTSPKKTAEDKRERFEQMNMTQEKQARQQKQMRDRDIRNEQIENEMIMRRQEKVKKPQNRNKKREEVQQTVDRRAAQSPERTNRQLSPNPQNRRQPSPTRQQQQKFYELQQQQQKFYQEQQRQNQINEDLERQRYLSKLEAEKQKLYARQLQKHRLKQREEQQRQISEDQKLETEYQSEEVPSQEDDEVTEATEPEDVDTHCPEDGRLQGGMDTYGDDGYDAAPRQRARSDMWDEEPPRSRAPYYPPGNANNRIMRGRNPPYQNRAFKTTPNYQGGQDYNDEYEEGEPSFERGGEDYGACGYDQSSADDVDDDEDFEDESPSPRLNYIHMNPKIRTVSSYQVEYSDDAIDETEHNVTVENDGKKQTLRVQSRSFLAGDPINFEESDYNAYNPYGNDLGATRTGNSGRMKKFR